MVQSEFNLVFWFVSYNIFHTEKSWHGLPRNRQAHCLSLARPSSLSGAAAYEQYHAKYRGQTLIMYDRVGYRVWACLVAHATQKSLHSTCHIESCGTCMEY
jgi:hypothetical protein